MKAINRNCPQCGEEIGDCFANVTDDNTEVLQDFSCDYFGDSGAVCGKCARVVRVTDDLECEHCNAWLRMEAEIEQPCDDNERVLSLSFRPHSGGAATG